MQAFVPPARKEVYISGHLVAMRNLQALVLNLFPSSGFGQPPYSRVAVLGDSKSKFRNPWVRVKRKVSLSALTDSSKAAMGASFKADIVR